MYRDADPVLPLSKQENVPAYRSPVQYPLRIPLIPESGFGTRLLYRIRLYSSDPPYTDRLFRLL